MLKLGSRFAALCWLAGLLMLLSAPAARAQIYYGSWDPEYGASFTGLGWRGTANFFVPGNCGVLPGEDATKNNATDCVLGGFGEAIVSYASVEFYDVNLPPVQPTINSISWGSLATPFTPIPLVNISDLLFEDGRLVQLRTNLFPFATPLPTDPINSGSDFALQFVFDYNLFDEGPLYSGPILYDTASDCEIECPVGRSNVRDFPPNFRVVPEPASLALLAGALLAAGLGSRRRRGLQEDRS